jgi:cytochrome d ubiquinol oxidase subunit II
MTVVVIIFLPLVLGYQAWTYYVFRRRVSAADFQPVPRPRGDSPGAPPSSPVTGDGSRDPSAI